MDGLWRYGQDNKIWLLKLKIYPSLKPFLQLVPHLLIVIFVFNIIQEFNEGVPTFYPNDFHGVVVLLVFPAVVAGTTTLALAASCLVACTLAKQIFRQRRQTQKTVWQPLLYPLPPSYEEYFHSLKGLPKFRYGTLQRNNVRKSTIHQRILQELKFHNSSGYLWCDMDELEMRVKSEAQWRTPSWKLQIGIFSPQSDHDNWPVQQSNTVSTNTYSPQWSTMSTWYQTNRDFQYRFLKFQPPFYNTGKH